MEDYYGEDEIRIYPRKKALIFYTVCGLVFVVGCIIIIGDHNYSGILCLLFFGPATVKLGLTAFSKKPLIIINDKGFYHQNVGLIKWEDIELVRTHQKDNDYTSNKYFSIIAKESYRSSMSALRRTLSNVESFFGYGTFNIPEHLFNIPINDLARMIHQRYGVNISLEIAD
ncbi:STM3941 family protein [Desulforamulus aeronauticus]|uniref:Uncharacterized protein n=1 Tax=Desulforamulus aeronauticus DSM 10349 TaxID=1121421 RepID=A0A1M6PVD6_9FIRM|nr:STM3941 family protein [Desulforamulus aeronauticus]SHK11909.1 hypothetical protein SAMN02745123_00732 [Desulforamulus aeronauticus DSM 10349]